MDNLRQKISQYIEVFCGRWNVPYQGSDSDYNSYDDPNITTASSEQSREVEEFFTEMVSAFPNSQSNFLSAVESIDMSKQLKDVYATAVGNGKEDMRKPFTSWADFFADGKHKNAEVKAGGGFGFGFQVYCGCDLIVSTGMGFGGGLDAHDKGGLGGGGGLQLYKDGKMQASIGGGGGGDLDGKFGTAEAFPPEDDDQMTGQAQTIGDLREQIVDPQISSCPSGKVSVTAGGGLGLGFVITIAGETTAYGGGLDMWVSSANFAQNDAACGGSISNDTKQDHSIDEAQKKCRIQCMQDPPTFNTCFCTCTKQAYEQSGHDWAKHMKCSDGIADMMRFLV